MFADLAKTAKTAETERWYVVMWLVWGVLCASVIALHDRSWFAAVAWLTAAVLAAAFSFPIVGAMVQLVSPTRYWWRGKWHDISELLEFEIREDDDPSIVLGGRTGLPFLDPNRKPWEVVPIAASVGMVHGVLLGGLLGALMPWCADWGGSSWQGALLCAACGVPALGLLDAAATSVFVMTRNGPRIEPLERLLARAEREAAARRREFVGPADLLVIVLQQPGDELRQLLTPNPPELAAAIEYVRRSTPMVLEYRDDGEFTIECDPTAIPSSAIDQASKLGHASVRSAHVLLALLAEWPDVTSRALELAGVPAGDYRQQVLECMRLNG